MFWSRVLQFVFSLLVFTFIAPRKLPNFYHVYGEVALEFFFLFFWLVSFAAMAEYVSTFDWSQAFVTSDLDPSLGVVVPTSPLLQNMDKAINSLKAVIVFGALLL
jgi:hypothetical protein